MKRMQVWLPVIAGLILPAALACRPAVAAVKSADEIACELAGDCAALDAASSDPVAVPDEEDAPTRGWTFGTKQKAKDKQPEQPVVNRPAQRVVPARPRPAEFTSLDVQFPRGSAAIAGDAASQMDELYNALRRPGLNGRKYRIVGHTVACLLYTSPSPRD